MINNKPNKKYKCSCEDIQRKILVKYFIDFCLKSQFYQLFLSLFTTALLQSANVGVIHQIDMQQKHKKSYFNLISIPLKTNRMSFR